MLAAPTPAPYRHLQHHSKLLFESDALAPIQRPTLLPLLLIAPRSTAPNTGHVGSELNRCIRGRGEKGNAVPCIGKQSPPMEVSAKLFVQSDEMVGPSGTFEVNNSTDEGPPWRNNCYRVPRATTPTRAFDTPCALSSYRPPAGGWTVCQLEAPSGPKQY